MKKKNLVFTLLSIFVFYILFEFLCFSGELTLSHFKGMKYSPHLDMLYKAISKDQQMIIDAAMERIEPRRQFDSELGWKFTPNYRTPWEIMTNGIRDEKTYDFKKTKGLVRMLAFGDSFTYCDEVSNKSTWEYFLNSTGNLEVLNFGVPGYGLDQAYLRYLKEGWKYEADYVFIGYMSENINRHINTFRYFYSPVVWYYSKPRFYLENGQLKLFENYFKSREDILKLIHEPKKTIQELGAKDFYYQTRFYGKGFFDFLPSVRLFKVLFTVYREEMIGMFRHGVYNTNSEAYQVTEKIFDAFVGEVEKNHSTPIIILFPDKDDFLRRKAGKSKSYEALMKHFDAKGYNYIDLMDAFDKYRPQYDLENLISNHYSPLGNMIVTKWIADYFRSHSRY